MDLGAALPDRCVACNQPAAKRISRTLYWSPAAWRYLSGLPPLALLFGGAALGIPMLALLFWPALIIIGIAHYFVRKNLALDLAACERHRRVRTILRGLSVASVASVVLVFYNLTPERLTLLVASVVLVVVLAVVQGFVGVQAVSLKKLDREHAWLGGTGKPFREALPELPGT